VAFVTAVVLFIRLLFFSGLRWRTRLITVGVAVAAVLLLKSLFRIQGVTGDLLPIIVWRSRPPESVAIVTEQPPTTLPGVVQDPVSFVPTAHDFPQFMGPGRNGTVAGPALARDWQAEPPQLVWRQPIGPAWSAAMVGLTWFALLSVTASWSCQLVALRRKRIL